MAGSELVPISMLKRLEPFSAISEDHLPEIQKKGRMVLHGKGTILFKRGDSGEELFYLLQGGVDLADANYQITQVQHGTGEAMRPLCDQNPRAVTAVTTSPVCVFIVRKEYVDLVRVWDKAGNYFVTEVEDEGDWMTSLLSSAMFAAVPPTKIQQLFTRFEEVRMPAGQVVIRQGEPGDYFYVLKSGTCNVTRRLSQAGQAKEITLAELGSGDMFGEDALIGDMPRNATVTMASQGALMRLDQEGFADLLQNPVITYILYAEFQKLVQEPKGGIELLDVRPPSEFKQNNVPGSRNLPLHAIRQNLTRLSSDTVYVLTCDGGRRSILGSYILTQEGFDARVLKDPPSVSSSTV